MKRGKGKKLKEKIWKDKRQDVRRRDEMGQESRVTDEAGSYEMGIEARREMRREGNWWDIRWGDDTRGGQTKGDFISMPWQSSWARVSDGWLSVIIGVCVCVCVCVCGSTKVQDSGCADKLSESSTGIPSDCIFGPLAAGFHRSPADKPLIFTLWRFRH